MKVSTGLTDKSIRIAIVIHVYYQAQFEIIAHKIQAILAENQAKNFCLIDIHITLPNERESELHTLIQQALPQAKIHILANYGMDLLPFFTLMPVLQQYDWVLKLHTKNNHSTLNKIWFETVIDGLIGSPDLFFDTLATLMAHAGWGMAGLLPFFLSSEKLKLGNDINTQKLAQLWQLDISQEWGFFAGSFYWLKPQILLQPAQKLLEHTDWFKQDFAHDGQMAHAVERLITRLVSQYQRIGLLFLTKTDPQNPPAIAFYIEETHPFAINQAFSHPLLESYQTLSETVAILDNVNLLDVPAYQEKSGINFPSANIAYEHFALVGQFSALASMVLPIALKREQEKLFSWEKVKQKQRIKNRVSIIIPVFNEIKLTLLCLESIRKHTVYPDYEIIVVDNGSDFITQTTLKAYAKLHPKCQVYHLKNNFNFSIGCNYGLSQSNGEYVLFLNNDTQVTKGWLQTLVESLLLPNVAMVQPLLCYPDNTVQCAGIEFGEDGFGYERLNGESLTNPTVKASQACSALTGACMLLRAEDFAGLNGFDTWYINGQEDIDLCLKIRALNPNNLLWYEANSLVIHATLQSVGRRNFINQNRQMFNLKWKNKDMKQLSTQNLVSSRDTVVKTESKDFFIGLGYQAIEKKYSTLAMKIFLMIQKYNPLLKEIASLNLYILELIDKDLLNTIEQSFKKEAKISTLFDNLNIIKSEVLLSENNFLPRNIITDSPFYIGENDDPYFLILNDAKKVDKGFYSLSFYIYSEVALEGQVAKLYVGYGEDLKEDDVIILPLKTGLNQRIIFFPDEPVLFKFDPLESSGAFLCLNFEICSLVDKILVEKYFHKNFAKNKIAYDSKDSLTELYQKYNTFLLEGDTINLYERWQSYYEANPPSDEEVRSVLSQFKEDVVFSVVIPVYNTPPALLEECIDSILNQRFNKFEICIADDNSPNAEVKEKLLELSVKDSRVKVIYRKQNGHISEASNSALELATGSYIVLIDHDDLLAKDAFYYVAKSILENPDAKILYSDEDKIDIDGVRSNPHFKSQWNPDLFFSQNYVSHLGVYNKEIIDKIQGFRRGVEGSQDQDLLLRCLPYVKNTQIIHIPRVLYHWRTIEGSTASGSGEKSYTTDAGITSLQDYFDNNYKNVLVEKGLVDNTYKVIWPIPTPSPKVSLIIPTRDGKDITEQAVLSILNKTTYGNYEIVIVDNGSEKQETLDFFRDIQLKDSRVTVMKYDYPFNYSAINNYAVKHTDGEIIGLINNDVEVINPEWLTEMVRHVLRPDIGCVGAKLYYSNGQIQHAGVILGIGSVAGHSHKYYAKNAYGYFSKLILPQNLSAVTAACLLIRREVYEEVGGLNERDLTVAFNDVDFCLKVMTAGYRNLWTPYAELYHHESISRGHENTPEKVARFNKEVDYMKQTWGKLLEQDPYYSPNLTLKHEDFSIRIE